MRTDNTRAFYKKHVDCYPFITRLPVSEMSIDDHEAVIELLELGFMTVKVFDEGLITYEFHKLKDYP